MDPSSVRIPQAAIAALQRGDILAAIKATREAGGIDLAEAKRMLQAHARAAAAQAKEAAEHARATRPSPIAQPRRVPTVAPGDAPGSLRGLVVAVVLAVAAWLVLGADVGA
jgi:hypothetical protein